jgi:hypothetical protein
MRKLLEPRLQEVPGCDGAVNATESGVVRITAGEGAGEER